MNQIEVLFLASNPTDTPALRLDEEIRAIDAKIDASGAGTRVRLSSKWAVRVDDLLQALNKHKPSVVHFSGHGSKTNNIILSDGSGQPREVPKEGLTSLFNALKDNIRLVVLNACYSREIATAITEVIDCAVGMTGEIGDEAAIVFSAAFYRAIGFGRSVKNAFEQGIAALQLENIPEDGIPKLIVKRGVDPNNLVLLPPANPR